jgi:geranylgeranyl pyrophosphate synthase
LVKLVHHVFASADEPRPYIRKVKRQYSMDGLTSARMALRQHLIVRLRQCPPDLRSDLIRALEAKGKLLSSSMEGNTASAGAWALLPFFIAQSIDPAIPSIQVHEVAIAVEICICALDIIDDVEDEDQTPFIEEVGIARALNTATALLSMASQAILSLSTHGRGVRHVVRLLEIFHEHLLTAVHGQHHDLLAERRSILEMTQEECIHIAAEKAGALMSMACCAGALCAQANSIMLERFTTFGRLFGIAQQLDNDCHDLYYLIQDVSADSVISGTGLIGRQAKTDLRRNKKTLPIVLAGQRHGSDVPFPLPANQEDRARYTQALHEAIFTTWGICLLYKERARETLQTIEQLTPIAQELRLLLDLA